MYADWARLVSMTTGICESWEITPTRFSNTDIFFRLNYSGTLWGAICKVISAFNSISGQMMTLLGRGDRISQILLRHDRR